MGRYYKKGRKYKTRKIFKECQFCKNKKEPDYKDIQTLTKYTYESGKIISKKVNSNCTRHQRKLATAVKRARFLALLPFSKRVRK